MTEIKNNSEKTGIFHLEIGRDRNGKSVAKRIFHQGGIKIQRPVYLDGGDTPCFYMLNPHAAFLGGDVYEIDIKVHEDARLTLTTQGANLVYKAPNKEAYQETKFYLEKNSYFEYLPGATIGYQNAKFHQRNIVHLKEGATFLYLDIITSGWSPEGEDFTYTYLRSKTEVYLENELVVYDHIKLAPDEQKFNVLGYLEEYTHFGTFMVINEQVDQDLIDRVYGVLEETVKNEDYDMEFGISRLSVPGFTIRMLGNMTQHLENIAFKCRNFLNKEWYGTTLGSLRKY